MSGRKGGTRLVLVLALALALELCVGGDEVGGEWDVRAKNGGLG